MFQVRTFSPPFPIFKITTWWSVKEKPCRSRARQVSSVAKADFLLVSALSFPVFSTKKRCFLPMTTMVVVCFYFIFLNEQYGNL